MARRPASVLRRKPSPGTLSLGVPLAAFVYFAIAPALPELPAGDAGVLVAGGVGLLIIAAATLSLVPARDTTVGPLLIALGAGLLVAALNAGGVGAVANVFEVLLAGTVGLLFARALSTPVIVIAVPIFVAATDIWSVASGPSSRLLDKPADSADALSFDLPAWGGCGQRRPAGPVRLRLSVDVRRVGVALRVSPHGDGGGPGAWALGLAGARRGV